MGSKNNGTEPMKIVWFSDANYPKIRELLTDGSHLPDQYEQWVELIEEIFDGLEIKKINIEPDEFQVWCVSRGITPSLTACRKYIVNR
jgi:hypothetical protein